MELPVEENPMGTDGIGGSSMTFEIGPQAASVHWLFLQLSSLEYLIARSVLTTVNLTNEEVKSQVNKELQGRLFLQIQTLHPDNEVQSVADLPTRANALVGRLRELHQTLAELKSTGEFLEDAAKEVYALVQARNGLGPVDFSQLGVQNPPIGGDKTPL